MAQEEREADMAAGSHGISEARVIPVHWPGQGLRVGRRLLLDINGLGLPCGCEFLDTISPQARSPAAPVLHKSL